MRTLTLALALISTPALSHEMTPAYFELNPSYIDGVLETKITIFNRREDAEYYEIDVYDKNWNKISFVSETKIVNVNYLETKDIDIFIRQRDRNNILYICTTSKLKKEDIQHTGISSRICSKLK